MHKKKQRERMVLCCRQIKNVFCHHRRRDCVVFRRKMDSFGLHPRIVQALNGGAPSAIEAAAQSILGTLTGQSSPAQGAAAHSSSELSSAAFDGLCMVLAVAVQHRLTPAVLHEQLSAGSLRSDVARSIVQSYKLTYKSSEHPVENIAEAARAVHEDGFLPRITGISWQLGHALGDRMLDPPSHSLPAFDMSIATYDHMHDEVGEVMIELPAERLSDLHNTVREMLREADHAATRGNIA